MLLANYICMRKRWKRLRVLSLQAVLVSFGSDIFSANHIDQQWHRKKMRSTFPVRAEMILSVGPHLRKIIVEQIAAVPRASLRLRVKLCAEYWAASVHYSFVRSVVEVHKVLFEIGWQCANIDSITMILARDMALPTFQIQCGYVVSTITILHLYSLRSCCNCEKLVAQTYSHNWYSAGVHQMAKIVTSVFAPRRVACRKRYPSQH